MVQKVTRWTMDCGCSVSYTWESDSDEATRVHTGHESHHICHGHTPLVPCVDGEPHPHGQFEMMLKHCQDKAAADAEAAAQVA